MGEQPENSAGASGGDHVTIHIRCSNGNKFLVEAVLTSTVGALKVSLVEKSEIPVDQQRLIYKGRVLKDDNSLESYGLQHDHTVHLVRGAPSSASVAAAAATPPAALPGLAGAFPAAASPALGSAGGLEGLPFLGPGGATAAGLGPEFQHVQQQLIQNPNLMREMMNMPAVQNLMNNPEMMRSLIMSNPQMRDIIDRNPDLAHILNDPGTLRQTLDAARNPELMREMMRNTDRAMSNIEASPEGFNMLRRMYETVQEPLMNAAAMGSDTGSDTAANPFGGLLGLQQLTLNQTPPPDSAASPLGAPNSASTTTTLPNTAPLPNPWNPQRGTGGANTTPQGLGGSTPASTGFGSLAGLTGPGGLGGSGTPDLSAFGGLGFGLDPNAMQQMLQNPAFLQMLQNPAIQQMMQGLLANPQSIMQMLNMQPHLQMMLNANPQIREMMQSPDFVRQIASPESFQQMFQQAGLGQMPGRPQAEQSPVGVPGSVPVLDLNSLYSMWGGLGGGFPLDSAGANVPPPNAEQVFAQQLSQLQEMGFFDQQTNIRALTASGGDVQAAVEWLLRNQM